MLSSLYIKMTFHPYILKRQHFEVKSHCMFMHVEPWVLYKYNIKRKELSEEFLVKYSLEFPSPF